MAKFVLAGRVDCPRYARAEMLAENLRTQLPHFDVNKIVVSHEEWPSWVQETCKANGWTHPPSSSPLIWRELIDRGGKGVYMGGLESFCSYTAHYYNIVPSTTEDLESKIAAENLDTFDTIRLEKAQNMPPEPLRICITNASSPLAYQLAPRILLDMVFGNDQCIHLILLNTLGGMEDCESVRALAMELEDLAIPSLSRVTCTDSPQEAFKAVSAVFVLDEFKMPSGDSTVTPPPTRESSAKGGVDIVINDTQIFGTAQSNESVRNAEDGSPIQITEQPSSDQPGYSSPEGKIELQPRQDGEGAPEQQPLPTSTSEGGLESKTSEDNAQTLEQQSSSNIDKSQSIVADESKQGDSQTNSAETDNTPVDTRLLKAANKYTLYSGILDYAAHKDVKVIIVGRFSNIGAALMARQVSSIDKRNFIASSGLVESQASSVLASKLGVASADVRQVGIWGSSQGNRVLLDVSRTMISHFMGSIVGPDDFSLNIRRCLFDHKWLNKEFPKVALDRHNNRSCYGDRGVYMAEAISLVKVMKDWWNKNEAWHSVGVVFEGEDLAQSCPCMCQNGTWVKAEGCGLEEENTEQLKKIANEMKKEFETALAFIDTRTTDNETVTTPTSKL